MNSISSATHNPMDQKLKAAYQSSQAHQTAAASKPAAKAPEHPATTAQSQRSANAAPAPSQTSVVAGLKALAKQETRPVEVSNKAAQPAAATVGQYAQNAHRAQPAAQSSQANQTMLNLLK